MSRKMLVVAPHPDDDILGCGGVMALHAASGDEVSVLVVSRGIPSLFAPEEIERTRKELSEAHQILGVEHVRFLDFPAPKLDTVPAHELADAILDGIDRFRPSTVYIPHCGDLHLDHWAVHHASLVALRPINEKDERTVERVLSYETLSETEWGSPHQNTAFTPTVFVDIENYLNCKLKAMACLVSQLKNPPHPRSIRGIEALARLRGSAAGFDAAESFMLVRERLARIPGPEAPM